MTTYVALLRAVNVGGRTAAKGDLVAAFEQAGMRSARTYIQSGNVVFESRARNEQRLAAELSRRLGERFGFGIPVVLRSGAELRKVVERDPFAQVRAAPNRVHVVFLDRSPASEKLDTLEPRRAPSEELRLAGRELYLHAPDGLGRSKLTNAVIDRALGVVSTARNWSTVAALADLAA